MTGWLTVSKALDWSKNTGPFNLRFPYLLGFFQGVQAPFAVHFPPCIVVFKHEGCECVRAAVLFQGDLKGLP